MISKELRSTRITYADTHGDEAAYREFGIKEATLMRYRQLQKKDAVEVDDTIVGQSLIRQNQSLIKQLGTMKDVTNAIVDCCRVELSKKSFSPIKVPHRANAKESLDMHLLRSDAQVGQYTDASWVQGLSHYDSETYRERVGKLTEKVLLFRGEDEGSLGLNKLVVHHLGDQVEGENIFKGQSFYLDLNLVNQLFHSVEVESNFLLSMAKVFPEVEVFCVIGNHGRPGAKGQNHHKTNFDYIFYRILQMALAHQKNIKIYVSESPSMVVQHGEKLFILNHGDTAKSWQGIPFYGLERMFRRLPGLYNMVIDYCLCGHHHQPANIADRILMNGCLPGGSDLSINSMGSPIFHRRRYSIFIRSTESTERAISTLKTR